MAVARVTTIIGSSPRGWQDAVSEALKRANKTLRNLTGIRVLEQTAHIEKGKITEYRSKVEVTFILED
jgi:flavin-binding protein dodecin